MNATTLPWLVCCVLVVIGLVAAVTIVVVRHGRRHGPAAAPLPALPDFAVIDCGEQIHFVPLPEDDHVLGSGRCPCQPRRTANRRRCGRRVLYYDHHSVNRRSSIHGPIDAGRTQAEH